MILHFKFNELDKFDYCFGKITNSQRGGFFFSKNGAKMKYRIIMKKIAVDSA